MEINDEWKVVRNNGFDNNGCQSELVRKGQNWSETPKQQWSSWKPMIIGKQYSTMGLSFHLENLHDLDTLSQDKVNTAFVKDMWLIKQNKKYPMEIEFDEIELAKIKLAEIELVEIELVMIELV